MKKTLLSLLTFVALMAQAQNPFFQEFGTYKELMDNNATFKSLVELI